VKSVATTYAFGGGHGYRTASCHSRGSYKDLPYSADDIDFLIAYIVPRDVWFVPVKLVPPVIGMCFYPLGCRRGGYYEACREAWHLMAPGGDLKPQPPIPIRVPPIGRPRNRQADAKPRK
jgi:hypothetical protein